MTSELSRQLAAQAWCTETTKHIVMDGDLAEAFAEILDKVKLQTEAPSVANGGLPFPPNYGG